MRVTSSLNCWERVAFDLVPSSVHLEGFDFKLNFGGIARRQQHKKFNVSRTARDHRNLTSSSSLQYPSNPTSYTFPAIIQQCLQYSYSVDHPELPTTAFIRSNEFDSVLESLKVTVVKGDLSNLSKVTELSSQHDIVFNGASSFDETLMRAIVEGLKSKKGTLFHLGGAGNFLDGSQPGKYPEGTPKIWNVRIVLPCYLVPVF